ncbi:hypothetical protein H4R18_002147 [Coemansia javaensis]|uniref:Uncharacterized protein n=1 Tax=Coemansia javaensis TaxID=2761396 RepID=A0A9W8HII7_9FUNG|nr:hypothetical protein H4R18_002147 [Coemansia javaensis]
MCSSRGKAFYLKCVNHTWAELTCMSGTECRIVHNNAACVDPKAAVSPPQNDDEPQVYCPTNRATMCDGSDRSSFYMCTNNRWARMKCTRNTVCTVRADRAMCVDRATADAPVQMCTTPKATRCVPDNRAIFQVCADGFWANSTCAGGNRCLFRGGSALCVDKKTAEAPVVPCSEEKATRCVEDDKSAYQLCSGGYWIDATCDRGNVCAMKRSAAVCHDPAQPVADFPDQPCDVEKATQCVPGDDAMYQMCTNGLWANFTCDSPNVCRMQVLSSAAQLAQGFMDRLDAISRKLSQLGIHDRPAAPQAQDGAESGYETVASEPETATAVSPEAPSFRIVASQEKEVCQALFSPLDAVPSHADLTQELLKTPVVKIPIHHHVHEWLKKHVEADVVDSMFSIVEQVGNICPKLTPRVEAALQVRVASEGTESMQQSALDPFLMGIHGTATEYASFETRIDRNANETSTTKYRCRPDYLLLINGQLVFKGEEKRAGDVREIAEELISKNREEIIGKNNKIDYILGYATAGSRVLFECIYSHNEMLECSDILNLERIPDRVKMLTILINAMRVSYALYNTRRA